MEEKIVRSTSLCQADTMARFAGVSITEEQRYLYAVLRERLPGHGEGTVLPEGTAPVWTLSDQCLLAEVLLLTGAKENYHLFKSKYPNIFG